jgi:hypothetical protein
MQMPTHIKKSRQLELGEKYKSVAKRLKEHKGILFNIKRFKKTKRVLKEKKLPI